MSVEIVKVPEAKAPLAARPELGARGGNRAEESANLSLPDRVRPEFEAEGAVGVYGCAERKAEDAGASASGHEFRERSRVVCTCRIGTGKMELAIEELEHVIEALRCRLHGSGVVSGFIVIVLVLVLVFFFVFFRGIEEAALGVGGWGGQRAKIGGGRLRRGGGAAAAAGEEPEDVVVWIHFLEARKSRQIT